VFGILLLSFCSVLLLNSKEFLFCFWPFFSLTPAIILVILGPPGLTHILAPALSLSLGVAWSLQSSLPPADGLVLAGSLASLFVCLCCLIRSDRCGFSLTVCFKGACAWALVVWLCSDLFESGSLACLSNGLASAPWFLQGSYLLGFPATEFFLAASNFLVAAFVASGSFLFLRNLAFLLVCWLGMSGALYLFRSASEEHSTVTIALVSYEDLALRVTHSVQAVTMGAEILVWSMPGADCRKVLDEELRIISKHMRIPAVSYCNGQVFLTDKGNTTEVSVINELLDSRVRLAVMTDINDPREASRLVSEGAQVFLYFMAGSRSSAKLRAVESGVPIAIAGAVGSFIDEFGEEVGKPGGMVIEHLSISGGCRWRLSSDAFSFLLAVSLMSCLVYRRATDESYSPIRSTHSHSRSLVSLMDDPTLGF